MKYVIVILIFTVLPLLLAITIWPPAVLFVPIGIILMFIFIGPMIGGDIAKSKIKKMGLNPEDVIRAQLTGVYTKTENKEVEDIKKP